MSEEQNQIEAETAPAENAEAALNDSTANEEHTAPVVPVRELQKERRERKNLEKQLQQLQQKQEEARQAELTEVERLKEELEQTRAAAAQAEQARVLSEQQSLVRTAASGMAFADVNDAITFVNFETFDGLEGSELAQAVSEEVARVSQEKPYLLAKTEEQHKRGIGKAADREGANEPPLDGEDALGGFVHGLLFGKR